MIAHTQLSMKDLFSECESLFEQDKPAFLSLLQKTIHLESLAPYSFIYHFYKPTGRPRTYSLFSMLWALILQKLFSKEKSNGGCPVKTFAHRPLRAHVLRVPKKQTVIYNINCNCS